MGLDGNFERDETSIDEIYESLKKKLPDTFDRNIVMAGSQKRKLRSPHEISREKVKGRWESNVFIPDDDYVNSNYNPQKLTFAQIKKKIYSEYGIKFEGIPFTSGVADFSSVSLADISIEELLFKAKDITHEEFVKLSFNPIQKAKLLYEVFTKDGRDQRNSNFHIADMITAERQIPIPGLPQGYNATQLAAWRGEHQFSWDEQLESGYHLVPSVIHDIVSHTGVVSVSRNAIAYLEKERQINGTCDKRFCIDEYEAPTNISGYVRYASTFRLIRKKGEVKMAKRKILSRGANIERHHGGDSDSIDTEAIRGGIGEDAEKKKKLEKLGEEFIGDKAKLEAEMDKVERSSISASDKKAILKELKSAIEALQEQYDTEVQEPYDELQEDMEEQIETAEEGMEEMQEQADSMRNVSMDASGTDASVAADAADEKKQEFKKIKQEAVAQLRVQIETANRQRRSIRANRKGN